MRTHLSSTAVILLSGVLSCGCAGLQHPSPPTVNQIVEMAKAGKPAEDIVRELQQSHAVYPLTGSQIVKLHEEGVPDAVLDYMQNAYADSIRWNARMQYEGNFWWNDCFYCYYRPVIVRPH